MKLAKGRDLTIESYSPIDDKPWIICDYRIAGVIKDTPATRRIYEPPKTDSFLAYLEYKSNQPFLVRLFMP